MMSVLVLAATWLLYKSEDKGEKDLEKGVPRGATQ